MRTRFFLGWTLVGALARLAAAQDPVRVDAARREEVLEGLAAGMRALEILGRERELAMLRRVADEVRGAPDGSQGLEAQVAVLRSALAALEDVEGRGLRSIREALQHAIRAREIRRDGAGDEDAERVLRTQPPDANLQEILRFAARHLRLAGDEEGARRLERDADEWKTPPARAPRADAMRALDLAQGALQTSETAPFYERLRKRSLQLRRGEAWSDEEKAQVVEILALAERRLQERKADADADHVRRYRERLQGGEPDLAERIRILEAKVARLTELVESTRKTDDPTTR